MKGITWRTVVVATTVLAGLVVLSCAKEKSEPEARATHEHETAAEPKDVEEVWVCECCPDVRSAEPGVCPKCNMRLTPAGEKGGIKKVDEGAAEEWTCGMHPAIRSEEPGKCPICNMDLIPVAKDDSGALRVNPETVRLVGVGVGEVDYLPLVRAIWTVGKVDYDETLVKHVASRVQGRVERLFIDFQGSKVSKGEPILSVYSPELVTALEEYRASLRADAATASIEALARSAEMRLKLWGLDDREIKHLLGADVASAYEIPVRSPISGTVIEKNVVEGKYVKEGENLYVVADLSRVWITAEVYEDDIADVMLGNMVMVTARAYPREVFHGKVAFIDPYLNEHTRAAGIRIEVNNPDERLKPGMYVEAVLEVPVNRDETVHWICPMHPDVVARGPGECPECGMFLEKVAAGLVLAVPKVAVVHTADLAQVYVERREGVYEVRRVELGQVSSVKEGTGEYYPVLDGLSAHERVVTEASFLIHSQARLTGKAASAYGGALGVEAPVLHQH